ncbi:MAG: hypothetical protein ACMG6S_21970, partial [Byssovorax sp.]
MAPLDARHLRATTHLDPLGDALEEVLVASLGRPSVVGHVPRELHEEGRGDVLVHESIAGARVERPHLLSQLHEIVGLEPRGHGGVHPSFRRGEPRIAVDLRMGLQEALELLDLGEMPVAPANGAILVDVPERVRA